MRVIFKPKASFPGTLSFAKFNLLAWQVTNLSQVNQNWRARRRHRPQPHKTWNEQCTAQPRSWQACTDAESPMPTDGTVSIIGVVVGSENYDAEKSLPFVTSPVQWQNVTQIVPPIHSNAHQTIRIYLQNKKSHKINIILLGESTDWPTKTDFANH